MAEWARVLPAFDHALARRVSGILLPVFQTLPSRQTADGRVHLQLGALAAATTFIVAGPYGSGTALRTGIPAT